MKISLNISKELLEEAKVVTGTSSTSQLVENALHSIIDRSKRKRLIESKGTLNLDINLDDLRNRTNNL